MARSDVDLFNLAAYTLVTEVPYLGTVIEVWSNKQHINVPDFKRNQISQAFQYRDLR